MSPYFVSVSCIPCNRINRTLSTGNSDEPDRPAPLTWWQLDCKDSRFIPPDPDGKQLHVVETVDILDVGSDWLLCCEAAADYTAETVFPPLVAIRQR